MLKESNNDDGWIPVNQFSLLCSQNLTLIIPHRR